MIATEKRKSKKKRVWKREIWKVLMIGNLVDVTVSLIVKLLNIVFFSLK